MFGPITYAVPMIRLYVMLSLAVVACGDKSEPSEAKGAVAAQDTKAPAKDTKAPAKGHLLDDKTAEDPSSAVPPPRKLIELRAMLGPFSSTDAFCQAEA